MPLADGYVHDLDAMLAEVTAATQLVLRLQPEQPDRHPPAGRARSRRSSSRCPPHVTGDPRRGLRRVPDRRGPRHDASTCCGASRTSSLLRTFCKVYGLAGPARRLRARLGEVPRRGRPRAPAVQRQRARAGGGDRGAPHQDDVAERVERNDVERALVEEELARAGPRASPTARPTSAGSRSATTTRARSSRRSASAGVAVRAGQGARRPGPHPRHLRHARPRTSASSRRSRRPCREIARFAGQSARTCYKLQSMNRASTSAYLTAPTARAARVRCAFFLLLAI